MKGKKDATIVGGGSGWVGGGFIETRVKTVSQTSCLIGHKRPCKFGGGTLQKHFSNINASWKKHISGRG